MDWQISNITKREAAGRQLDQAILMFFRRDDMLSVHTLTGAAFQLLVDLGKDGGIVSRARSEDFIYPAAMKKWVQALNNTQNFLKHADKDPTGTLRYAEEGTVLFLYEATELAVRMGIAGRRETLAFRVWFALAFPELIQPAVLAALRAANTSGLDQTDRRLWAQWLDRSSG